MIDPGLWGILLPAAALALGLGWLIGRRAATAQAQELLLAQERYQALQIASTSCRMSGCRASRSWISSRPC